MVNLPLMNDDERQRVGTCYKQQGQQAAIVLGHQLVSGGARGRAHRRPGREFAQANPDGYLYCFRGGLRSQIVQQWLRDEAGIDYPRVGGGYKAMRTFPLETLDQAVAQCDFVLLGGMTGTGKTEVLGAAAQCAGPWRGTPTIVAPASASAPRRSRRRSISKTAWRWTC